MFVFGCSLGCSLLRFCFLGFRTCLRVYTLGIAATAVSGLGFRVRGPQVSGCRVEGFRGLGAYRLKGLGFGV